MHAPPSPRPRRPSPPTPAAGLWCSFSPQARPATHRPSLTSWPARAFPVGEGRPRTRPDVVLADKAYSSRAIREHLRRLGIRAVIPVLADQRAHRPRRGSRGVRPPAFDRETYERRNTVERCINPPEAVARHRHPLREDRHQLPGRTPHRRPFPLVHPMIRTKPPGGPCPPRRPCPCPTAPDHPCSHGTWSRLPASLWRSTQRDPDHKASDPLTMVGAGLAAFVGALSFD